MTSTNTIPTMQDAPPSSPAEDSPLLGQQAAPRDSAAEAGLRNPQLVIALLALSIMCSAGAASLVAVPITRLLEDGLCRRHYASWHGLIDERHCKVDAVQSDLAWLNGALSAIEAAVGVVVALPYGVLADRIGRRPVFALSSLGTLLALAFNVVVLRFPHRIPLYCILLSPLLQAIGGGETVLLAINYSIAANVAPTAMRADSFLRMAVASYVGRFVASFVSARLMQLGSVWVPILMAFVLIPAGTSVIFFIPETLQATNRDSDRDDRQRGVCVPPNGKLFARAISYLGTCLVRFARAASIIQSPSPLLVLFAFLSASPVSLGVGHLIVQYVSKRFGWSFAEAAYLRSVQGITDLIVLLVALPSLSALLVSSRMPFRLSPIRKDLALAQFSAFLMTCGTLLMAGGTVHMVVAGQVITTLGDGFISLCRSVITAFVDAEHASTLYTLISIAETLGSCAAGPALAWLFSAGMKLGGGWQGLPYLGIGALCALTTGLLLFVRLPAKP